MKLYGSSAKICATCEYWSGTRNPKISFVEVMSDAGMCYVTFNVTGIKRLCQEGCEKWCRWKILK